MANKIDNIEQRKTKVKTSKLYVFAKLTTYTNAIPGVHKIWTHRIVEYFWYIIKIKFYLYYLFYSNNIFKMSAIMWMQKIYINNFEYSFEKYLTLLCVQTLRTPCGCVIFHHKKRLFVISL